MDSPTPIRHLILCAVMSTWLLGLGRAQDLPPTPAPVQNLIAAVPFSLDQPYPHLWRANQPQVSTGYILVLAVDPNLVIPRQTYQPVLYVGHQTAERVNSGHLSGTVIAIVPGVVDDPSHPGFIDLTETLIWFGTPELPERVTKREIEFQHEEAVTQRFAPFSPNHVQQALQAGGQPIRAAHKTELMVLLANFVATYAPEEDELIDRLTRLLD